LANDLKKELQKIKVSVSGSVSYQALKEAQLTTRKTLFVHRSIPLKEIVRHTNYRSDNLYAEMLFRIVASRYGVPCTIKSSIRFINEYWKRKGLDLSSGRILDGCGLAPQDAISAEMFVDLLRYMYSSTEKEAFIASLPCSGESGTIKSFLKDTELHGKVYAKSGTIGGTKNFAGYIFLPDGRIWVFAVLVNSANCRSRRIQDIIEEYLLDVYKRNA
jgi:D-alanyl-D-alanine carboxypeptidase/D-alanyl-D-alanine-endopeptidase (penicillin-binding protein 4)